MFASDAAARFFRARVGVAAVFFLNGFGYGSWVPRIAEIQDKLRLSEGQLGLALLMIAVGALLAMPLAGAAAHRFGSRAASGLTVVLFGLGLPGVALAPGLLWIGLALLFLGAATGAMDVSMNAQGVAVEKRYWRPIMSSLHGMFSLGGMAGAAATGVIAAADLALLPHFLGVGAVVAVLGARCLPSRCCPPRPRGARRPRLRAPDARDPPARGGGARQPGFRGCHRRLERGLFERRPRRRHDGTAAAAFAAFSLAMAAGRFSGDRLVARLGGDLVVRAGGALAAAGLGLTLLIGHPSVAVLGFGLVGAGLSCVFPVVLSSAARTPGLPPSAAIAAVCTVGYFGFLLGPPMIGGLAELIGLPGALGLVVLLCTLIATLGSRAPTEHAGAAVSTSA